MKKSYLFSFFFLLFINQLIVQKEYNSFLQKTKAKENYDFFRVYLAVMNYVILAQLIYR
jgi:hypothetical protein